MADESHGDVFPRLGVDHLIFDGGGGKGCGNPPKKYRACASEFLRRKKISGSNNQGVAKDFCVIRDGPESSCESHDTELGITFFYV